MWIILRLLLLTSAVFIQTADSFDKWVCTGESAHRTYQDCQRLGEAVDDCYYLPHFGQYRSCASVCNDVRDNSINHERCISLCPDYLQNNCWLQAGQTVTRTKLQTTTTTSTTTATTSTTTVYTQSDSEIDEIRKEKKWLSVLVASVTVLAVLLAVLTVALVAISVKAKRGNRESLAGKQMPYYEYEYVKPELLDNSVNEDTQKYQT